MTLRVVESSYGGDMTNSRANDDRYWAERRKRSFHISRTDAVFAERENTKEHVKFEVLSAVTTKNKTLWDAEG
jgi:hypothetical protein